MAWIDCPECGKPTTDHSPICTHCGESIVNEKIKKQNENQPQQTNHPKEVITNVALSSKKALLNTKEHFNKHPKLQFRIGLGVSCLLTTTFGGLLLDGGSDAEERFYQAAMISSAIMVHLFALLLFGRSKSD